MRIETCPAHLALGTGLLLLGLGADAAGPHSEADAAGPHSFAGGGAVFFAVVMLAVMLLVRRVLGERERRVQLAERERVLAAREAVVAERARIARELHDVVAHSQVREAGLRVDLRVEGEPAQLPAGVDLSAYPIVQEALTNALKHAGHVEAEVIVRYEAAAVELEMLDNGVGPHTRVNGSGHGLAGMREHVALYGGLLEAGSRKGHGFAVRARLRERSCAARTFGSMQDDSLEEELLKAIRAAPGRRLDELAELVGLPRTNFGRLLGHRLRRPLDRLHGDGFVEEHDGRYRLAEPGRRLLAERAAETGEGSERSRHVPR